ncbi:MAG: glycoside hydrolase family 43 protein [bacterium]|nr:glycoside hydrolase family 43 protein [bacterium]
MALVKNPILKGFNPDPSIIQVEGNYYIATSTFEWFPGVQIHHSKDLINWELVNRPLNRISQLDMLGVTDSGGVWAPCLSYSNGTYYLVYSNVKNFDGVWKDTPNYLVTTKDILGEWSDPIFLSASGFDGSMFHDDDGKKWYSSMLLDHRGGKFFGGIVLQEYDENFKKLVGPIHHIFEGTELGKTEGPHIYKRNGYYYLITAEGGTEYDHAVSIARSKSITGPYELHPSNPIITTADDPNWPIQKTGHGDLVETPDGDWYTVFLGGRPLSQHGRCTLGRETCIHPMQWREDDWIYSKTDSKKVALQLDVPGDINEKSNDAFEDFNEQELPIDFQTLRVPFTDRMGSLKERPGFLRLYGTESLSSKHHQSLVARRVQSHNIEASTLLEFKPESFQQMAGLVCYYNTYHFHYLFMTGNGDGTAKLNIITCDKYNFIEPTEAVYINGTSTVYLKVQFHRDKIQYYYAIQPDTWNKIGPELNGSILSDDYVQDIENRYRPAFTGSFVGICCQDLSGQRLAADFDWFEYKEL